MTNTSTLQQYARIGATARRIELQIEIAEIRQMFPELGDGAPAPTEKRRGRRRREAAPPRKRRKMSAAGRKAISDAQKKRWAALKARKK